MSEDLTRPVPLRTDGTVRYFILGRVPNLRMVKILVEAIVIKTVKIRFTMKFLW